MLKQIKIDLKKLLKELFSFFVLFFKRTVHQIPLVDLLVTLLTESNFDFAKTGLKLVVIEVPV